MFTTVFGKYVCDHDSIFCDVDGFTCRAWTQHDDDTTPPDERIDGFWPSLDPKNPGYIGAKTESELVAAQAEAQHILDSWRRDDWDYCGVCVEISKHGVTLTQEFNHAIWGIERNYPGTKNEYLTEVANDLLPDAIKNARDTITKLCA